MKASLASGIQYSGSCTACMAHVPWLPMQDTAKFVCPECKYTYVWDKTASVPLLSYPPVKLKNGSAEPLSINLATGLTFADSSTSLPKQKFPKPRSITDGKNTWTEGEPDKIQYEKNYWAFVNSDTFERADYYFKEMLANVSLDLQPSPDGKSWVQEPKIDSGGWEFRYSNKIFAVLVLGAVMCLIFQLLGVKLH